MTLGELKKVFVNTTEVVITDLAYYKDGKYYSFCTLDSYKCLEDVTDYEWLSKEVIVCRVFDNKLWIDIKTILDINSWEDY